MCSEEYKCAHIVILQHSVTTHSWSDCTLIQVSYLHVEEAYLDYPVRYDRCSISYQHARGISGLPIGNGPGLQRREAVELDEIKVDWIGTKFMLADGLTKVLPGPALSDMRDKLHLVDVGPSPREPCGGVS